MDPRSLYYIVWSPNDDVIKANPVSPQGTSPMLWEGNNNDSRNLEHRLVPTKWRTLPRWSHDALPPSAHITETPRPILCLNNFFLAFRVAGSHCFSPSIFAPMILRNDLSSWTTRFRGYAHGKKVEEQEKKRWDRLSEGKVETAIYIHLGSSGILNPARLMISGRWSLERGTTTPVASEIKSRVKENIGVLSGAHKTWFGRSNKRRKICYFHKER